MRTSTQLVLGLALCLPISLIGCAPPVDDTASTDPGDQANLATRKDASPLGPNPAGRATSYPIVLAHGFMGSSTNIWSFYNVAEALQRDGHLVVLGQVPPFADPEVRADSLARDVDAALALAGNANPEDPPQMVNIIAHSMGGLDARVLASRPAYANKIASITTISTPHAGSLVADVALAAIGGPSSSVADVLIDAGANAFFGLLGGEKSALLDETNLRAALTALAVANSTSFNDQHPNLDSIYYQTWAGVSSITGSRSSAVATACSGAPMLIHDGTMDTMNALLWGSSPVVGWNGWSGIVPATEKPNDGVSTVQSARGVPGFECDSQSPASTLGCFHFKGCLPADHLGEVGQPKHDAPDSGTGFDHIRFYRNIAFDLAAKGY